MGASVRNLCTEAPIHSVMVTGSVRLRVRDRRVARHCATRRPAGRCPARHGL